ncbi:MAG: ATP-dependent zinc metalloprotease FtsH [Clostridia bacterium]|nr:ATP-dependent zinc metalloprotease FtsH [Clostridia bacterium]
MNDNKSGRNWFIIVGIPLLIIILMFYITSNRSTKQDKTYSEIVGYFETGKVESFTLDLNTSKLSLLLKQDYRTDINKDGKISNDDLLIYKVPNVNMFVDSVLYKIVNEQNRDDNPDNDIQVYDILPQQQTSWFVSFLPTLILCAMTLGFLLFLMKRMSPMGGEGKILNFGKARIRKPGDERRKVTFEDVAGADEEKEELEEIVEFLKSPKKYHELGARVPKGVLLVGPPGTGKTLLARAVAGEAKVPFFTISGSDFVEMYVGVGASRVRDLFEQAKKNSPCIVFIDEIDAVGRQRGAGLGGGHDEREQTLNQMLVEMDGFGANEGIIMIAATNRPDILDPALTRPGRFDRQVVVNYPDQKGREAILKVHAKGKPLGPDVDLSVIAKSTSGFTGADLENLLNEAALLAARRDLKSITMPEIEEATIKVVVGTEKKSHVISEEDKRVTAYHEAGHALVTYYSPTQDPVHQISIIPRGLAAGYTMNLPQDDHTHMTKTKLLESIQVMLGGRVAEMLTQDDICTGASNDIERATEIARKMVTKYGMSERLGPLLFGESETAGVFLGRDLGHSRNYSEETASKIDEEVERIINESLEIAKQKVSEHMDKLEKVASYLLEHEKLDADTFKQLMEE